MLHLGEAMRAAALGLGLAGAEAQPDLYNGVEVARATACVGSIGGSNCVTHPHTAQMPAGTYTTRFPGLNPHFEVEGSSNNQVIIYPENPYIIDFPKEKEAPRVPNHGGKVDFTYQGTRYSINVTKPEIIELQQSLNILGMTGANGRPLVVDGIAGQNTDFAVQKAIDMGYISLRQNGPNHVTIFVKDGLENQPYHSGGYPYQRGLGLDQ